MSEFVKALELSELENGQGRCVELEGKRIAVFKYDDSYFALDDLCTHAGASLAEGYVTEGCVRCPWHAADFDLKTGEAKTPPAYDSVRTYPVHVGDTHLEVQVNSAP